MTKIEFEYAIDCLLRNLNNIVILELNEESYIKLTRGKVLRVHPPDLEKLSEEIFTNEVETIEEVKK